jgi:hypothetical protein
LRNGCDGQWSEVNFRETESTKLAVSAKSKVRWNPEDLPIATDAEKPSVRARELDMVKRQDSSCAELNLSPDD